MLLHQDKYKTIPYRADIATYNQTGSGCSAIKFPNGQMEAPYLSLPDNGMSH